MTLRLYSLTTLAALAAGCDRHSAVAPGSPATQPTAGPVSIRSPATAHGSTNYLPLLTEVPPADADLLGRLRGITIDTPSKAEKAALGSVVVGTGLGADETVQTAGLYLVGRYDRLGGDGDWLWEVHVTGFPGGRLDGIVFVNARSGVTSAVKVPGSPHTGGG